MSDLLKNISVILCRPQLPENIGAVCRVMKNFGIADLRIVNPRAEDFKDGAKAMSAGASDLLEASRIYDKLSEAIEDLNVIYAATARDRDLEKQVIAPDEASHSVIENRGAKIGFMFGSEASGLNNEEISHANKIISIDTNSDYSSLNLAQAVCVCMYEVKKQEVRESKIAREEDIDKANQSEISSLVNFLESEIDVNNYCSDDSKKAGLMIHIRNIFTNNSFSKQDVKILRGLLKMLRES